MHNPRMRILLAHGEVLTLETDRHRYLGTVEVRGATFVIRSGYAGRPAVVDAQDVLRIGPVEAE
jgi:hypothetical protein